MESFILWLHNTLYYEVNTNPFRSAVGNFVEGSAELSFKTSKHAGAICVTEPTYTFDIANAHVIFPWMTFNVDTLIRPW